MKNIFSFVQGLGIAAVGLIAPVVAFALAKPPVKAPNDVLSDISEIPQWVCIIVDWLFWGLIVFSVIMVLLAAYGYLTSAGDPDKVKEASHRLLYAAIGILVGLIAVSFPDLVSSFLESGATSTVLAC